MNARLRVLTAGPLVTYQDAGRPGYMRFGVPASGPMDRLAHAAANAAIGNDRAATAIEISQGGVTLEAAAGAVTVAVTGGDFFVHHGSAALGAWQALTLREGERLQVRAGNSGSWAYLAVAGNLEVPSWLGHTGTHSLSGLGGGIVATGDEIFVHDAAVRADREGEIPRPKSKDGTGSIRVVLGPQTQHFDSGSVATITSEPYELTAEYDRMGVRLGGPRLGLRSALSIPSEAVLRGSVQVDGTGVPSLLFADHQTTGGYPKIATVISPDLDRAAQLRPGDTIRFAAIEPKAAVTAAREYAALRAEYLERIAGPGRTLSHRLASENLIGGVQP